MKYTTAVLALAAATAYAGPADTVSEVITQAKAGVDALDKAGAAFNGDVQAVKSKGDDLVSILKKGKATVDGISGEIQLTDAVKLAGPVQDLATSSKKLRDDFKAKISEIEKAKACSTVRSELSAINDASQALIKAVTAKVEKVAQPTAEQLAEPINQVLAEAQSDFSEQNCKDGSSGGSGGSSQSSAAPQSSAPAQTGGAGSQTSAGSAQPTGTEPCHKCEGGSGNNNGTTTPPVTAGASFMAPAGALVVAVAAALL